MQNVAPVTKKQNPNKVRVSLSILAAVYGFASTTTARAAETRLYTSEQCILAGAEPREKFAGGLLALFLPALIDRGLTAIGGALRKAGEKQERHYSANAPISLYNSDTIATAAAGGPTADTSGLKPEELEDRLSLSREFSCLLIASGNFKKAARANGFIPNQDIRASGVSSDAIPDDATPQDAHSAIQGRLAKLGIHFDKDGYNSVYETRVSLSPDETAFLLESQYLHIRRHASARGKTGRGVVYTISVSSPNTDKDGATLAAVPINFGNVTPGLLISKGQFEEGARASKSPYSTKPGLSAASKTNFMERGKLVDEIVTKNSGLLDKGQSLKKEQSKSKPDQTKIENLKRDIEELTRLRNNIRIALADIRTNEKGVNRFMPVNLTATLTETKDENAALIFLADVFDDSKKAVGDKLKERFVPETRQKAKQDLEDVHSKAYIAYLTAEDEYQKKIADQKSTELQKDITREKRDQSLRELNRVKRELGLEALRL